MARVQAERATGIGSVRKAFLLGTSALALASMASAAQAQCANSALGVGAAGGGAFNFGTTSSGTSSTVQSLISVLSTTNTAFLTQTSGFVGAPNSPVENLQGGGVWIRGVGGTLDTNTPGSYTYSGNAFSGGGGGSCNVRTFQDYSGVQLGTDISRLNIGGANVHIGVTGGYTESSVRSPTGGGILNGDFQIPFVGIYAAVTKDGFFADAQARWDFYTGTISDPTNAVFGQRIDARSLSLTGNLGKQFPLSDDWFIEPSAGIIYSQVKVDTFNLVGTYYILNSPGFGPPSSVKINDFDSILGRASVRVGKNFLVGDYAVQPFVTATVFHEFAGNVRTSINTSFDAFGVALGNQPGTFSALDSAAVLTATRIGTYGQFAVGIAGQLLNTGWLGYVRGDYRTGDRVEGFGISGGLRYHFSPETVARTLVTKGDAPSFVPALDAPVNWTGLSVGGSVGGNWSQTNQGLATIIGNGRSNPHAAGILAGGQVGADYQFGRFVVGVAGDFNFANGKGARPCPQIGLLFFYNCQTGIDFLTTATGRIGYATERTLFYAKGGYAFADLNQRLDDNTNGNLLTGGGGLALSPASFTSGADGWTLGGGIEFALTKNWSAKAEYMHYELQARRVTNFPAAIVTNLGLTSLRSQHTGDLVRIGVNYRFNFDPTPIVAPARTIIAKN